MIRVRNSSKSSCRTSAPKTSASFRCERWALAAALCLSLSQRAAGQGTAAAPLPSANPNGPNPQAVLAPGPRTVTGRVVTRIGNVERGVSGVWATLHRVGPDSAAPLDSMRTAPDGAYRFAYRAGGSDRAIYFVSASHDGIAYFSSPLKAVAVTGPEADVLVFDTTRTGVTLSERGRHVVVQKGKVEGERLVVEVFELENATDKTLVAGANDATATFERTLPKGATQVTAGQGDVSPEAFKFVDGVVRVYAPFAPGLKQLSYSYTLPGSGFPLVIPNERTTTVFEILLEEADGVVSGTGVSKGTPVAVQGRTFQRYLAQDAKPGGAMTIALPNASGSENLTVLFALIAFGALALVGVAIMGQRRTAHSVAPPSLGAVGLSGLHAARLDEPERVARAIADLDDAFARQRAPDDVAREAHRAARAALKARLESLLAARSTSP